MYSLLLMEPINWEIWMFPKCWKKIWLALKQGLHIMPVLKYGKISHMEAKVTFGPSVVCFIKCALSGRHLLPQIFKDFIEKYAQVFFKEFPCVIQMNFRQSSPQCLKSILIKDPAQTIFWETQLFTKDIMAKLTCSHNNNAINFFKLLSTIQKTWRAWKRSCLNQTMTIRRDKLKNFKFKI